jgi:hypothetical protein
MFYSLYSKSTKLEFRHLEWLNEVHDVFLQSNQVLKYLLKQATATFLHTSLESFAAIYDREL